MEKLYELKEILMDSIDELDTIKGHKLKMGELEAIKQISSAMDHLCNVIQDAEEEEGGSSYAGRRSYDRGGESYANRGRHYVRGHYSRDGGGGRSYLDGNSYAVDKLYEAERSAAGEQERNMIRQIRERMENMQ